MPERRIVRLITRLNIGGPARHALLLAKALRGSYTTVLGAGTPEPNEGELADPAVTVARLPFTRPVKPATDARALVATRRLLSATEPHVVHTHMAKAGAVGRVAARTIRPRPRTVHTFHGHVLEGYFRPSVQAAFLAAERGLARHTDRLVAVSIEIRDQLLKLGIGRPEQYRVIPLGLQLDAHFGVDRPSGALRTGLSLGADVPLVGTVGRLVPIKDVEVLLRALVGLPDVHVAIVGDGELRSELVAAAARLGVAGRTHFTGWRMDVPAVMSDLDVVVLTSRNEGTPVSLIEAGACARPVVATNVGGVPSVVADGVNGIVVPPGDPSAVAEALRRLLADADLRRSMSDAGRERARLFTSSRLLADIRALYDELLDGP